MANVVQIDTREWTPEDLLEASMLASKMAADVRYFTTHSKGINRRPAELVCESLAQLAMNLSKGACNRAI